MRLFSWAGCAALATAAVTGYLTSEAIHGVRDRGHAQPTIGFVEESEFVDRAIPGTLPTLPAEEIDLTCLPQKPPEEINRQTSEPPLADGPDVLRAIEYRPDPDIIGENAGPVTGGTYAPELPPPPARIPYLTDETPPPAVLRMPEGDDAANAYPVRQCSPAPTGPVWEAVSKYFAEAAKLLPSAHTETPPAIPGEPSDWPPDARWQPMCEPDVTNPNLGKPPTGVMQLTPEIGGRYPCGPEKWAATVGRPNS